MSVKKSIKEFLPPIFSRFVTGMFYGWYGNYSGWEDACKKCSGYDSQLILDKVKESSLKVKEGIKSYERDSVVLNEIQYNYPLLSGIMWIAAQNNGRLNVLDFGGSLGSSYYQNKFFLDSLAGYKWCIVEQSSFVKVGREYFSDEKLVFYYTIDDCLKENHINVIILSSVLPYIEKPYELLEMIRNKGFEYILVDRTPFVSGNERLTIQKVNPAIYKASYPCWFFNKQKFQNFLKSDYDIITEFETPDRANIISEFKGFLFRLKNTNNN